MKCDKCDREFSPATTWQRFCSSKCRDAWNNREKLRRQIEAAEERRAERLNGHDGSKEKIDLVTLGLASKPEPIKRRRFVA